MTDTTKLVHQLRALVLLTQTEEQVARTRISQARTDAVRRELTQNADNAAARSIEITEPLRALGGVPDVVTPAIGRLSRRPQGGLRAGRRRSRRRCWATSSSSTSCSTAPPT